MKSAYCLTCHRPTLDGLILSFHCDAAGTIEGICTTGENKPIAICKDCHAELTKNVVPSNRLIDRASIEPGEYYWTFGFPGKDQEVKSLKSLSKEHVQFLLAMVPNPPEELLAWINEKPETITPINDENKSDGSI